MSYDDDDITVYERERDRPFFGDITPRGIWITVVLVAIEIAIIALFA
jgi:hypothetical protein